MTSHTRGISPPHPPTYGERPAPFNILKVPEAVKFHLPAQPTLRNVGKSLYESAMHTLAKSDPDAERRNSKSPLALEPRFLWLYLAMHDRLKTLPQVIEICSSISTSPERSDVSRSKPLPLAPRFPQSDRGPRLQLCMLVDRVDGASLSQPFTAFLDPKKEIDPILLKARCLLSVKIFGAQIQKAKVVITTPWVLKHTGVLAVTIGKHLVARYNVVVSTQGNNPGRLQYVDIPEGFETVYSTYGPDQLTLHLYLALDADSVFLTRLFGRVFNEMRLVTQLQLVIRFGPGLCKTNRVGPGGSPSSVRCAPTMGVASSTVPEQAPTSPSQLDASSVGGHQWSITNPEADNMTEDGRQIIPPSPRSFGNMLQDLIRRGSVPPFHDCPSFADSQVPPVQGSSAMIYTQDAFSNSPSFMYTNVQALPSQGCDANRGWSSPGSSTGSFSDSSSAWRDSQMTHQSHFSVEGVRLHDHSSQRSEDVPYRGVIDNAPPVGEGTPT
ncbi:hypothetical protein NMY22_g9619 [Coprinellus aureogranulatus]|nr:hypothetical protein NMY22_g9619 [Coprinellus aureogranulatus]